MKRGSLAALTISLALLASLVLAPTAALADRFHGGLAAGSRVVGHGRIVTRPSASHRFVRHPFFRRPFFHRSFIPFWTSPVVVYAPPPVFYGPSAYHDDSPAIYSPQAVYTPAAVYSPPAGYSPSMSGTMSVVPAPPPTPSVIEYPTGRYELRGDGVTTPYTWVWIPNPPTSPPPGPPSEASVPPILPASGDQSPARPRQLYRWTDEQGAMHWTDRWDAVPEQYRGQAKQPRSS